MLLVEVLPLGQWSMPTEVYDSKPAAPKSHRLGARADLEVLHNVANHQSPLRAESMAVARGANSTLPSQPQRIADDGNGGETHSEGCNQRAQ